MVQWLMTAVAFLLGAVLMAALVHTCIELFRFILGKDCCFASEALNGCNTWIFGTFICAVFEFMAWPSLGFLSFAFLPLVPVAAALFWTIVFWILALGVRRREFAVRAGAIVRLKDGERLHPDYVVRSSQYSQTGPATGYAAYVLELGGELGIAATNVYVDRETSDLDYRKVLAIDGPSKCCSLDLTMAFRREAKVWEVVHFRPNWTPLLCSRLNKLSEADRAWWGQWLQPQFGPLGQQVVESDEFRQYFERLIHAYPWVLENKFADSPEDRIGALSFLSGNVPITANVRALRALLLRHGTLQLSTMDAFQAEHAREKRRNVMVEIDEDGVMVETIRE